MPDRLIPGEERAPSAADRSRRQRLPDPHRLLGWLYMGRLAGVLAFLAHAALGIDESPGMVIAAAMLLVSTLLVTGVSYWHSHAREVPVSTPFLCGQLLFDVVLLTMIVGFTGGPSSIFSPLYILIIYAGALLLPFYGGLALGALATVSYFLIVTAAADAQHGAVTLQIALFLTVTLVMGLLGERLRETGSALGAVETELRQLRLDTSDILSTIGTGIITVDSEGKLMYINPAALELLSLSEIAPGTPVLALLDELAPGLGRVIGQTSSTRTPVHRFETEPLSDDGFVLGVSTTVVERVESDQEPAVTAIFQDITQKMRVEGLRRRAERLEAVAELSASLAHEIKNPLASIRSAVEQIGDGRTDEEDGRLLTKLVLRESDRLSRLLTEFIDFARVKLTAAEPIELAAIVRQVVDLARAHPDAEDREISFEVQGDETRMTIRGAEDLLHRAVLNLVLNAVQWAGPGGAVRMTLDEVRSDLLSPALGERALVRLTVTDTGPGIEEEIVEHIFNPFFTRRTGGTGLGLAMVQRAVEAHGGAIFVDPVTSAGRSGAKFALYLPCVPIDLPANLNGASVPEETHL